MFPSLADFDFFDVSDFGRFRFHRCFDFPIFSILADLDSISVVFRLDFDVFSTRFRFYFDFSDFMVTV